MPVFVFVLICLIGMLHHYIGYKLILTKKALDKVEPKYLLGKYCTRRVLQNLWHFSTACWFGFAALIFVLSLGEVPAKETLIMLVSFIFSISGWLSSSFKCARTIYWLSFILIAGLSAAQT
ncbi:hypothetical protein L1286_14490 [Pseudoalteromonas sp. SMS1]|uniref:hypothetical protein n=1 Tax=Pseudoalteromonas sp. SMS1 TaxID=2908894 RepID=UPI001F169D12|nr:hypothetical protein [Pseudoalteromonas sp. SMS1]MCF2858692.1 hypothetical protein [Pseudoalteromonas sp. SMS1]